jgi:hypothetical protein
MAKKKAGKKAAKKVTKKKGSRAAATSAASEADLQAAAVVTWAAEGVLGAVEFHGFDIGVVVSDFPVTVQQVSASSSTAGERNGREGWEYARRKITRGDFRDKPFLRVVGRVAEILLNHRRFQTISAGDVFRVFLVEISDQLQVRHRQTLLPGEEVDVSAGEGRKTFNNRMQRLRAEELIRATATTAGDKDKDYVLTEDGQSMFDGWPPLSEIPGLELDGPVTPESRSRRRSRPRS